MRIGETGWPAGIGPNAERLRPSSAGQPREADVVDSRTGKAIRAAEETAGAAAAGLVASSSAVSPAETEGELAGSDRSNKVAAVKQAFQSGQPLDLETLADRLLESGVLFSNLPNAR
ncbi:flagellar biosynthesis anti-sigma factor FlgM [Alicyclobacillus kakegawensis]|uniref:flagellar biosynthesis anti-sigma factor FlgM n=1 Tax=Alicyclobacillus kakegawensis TaxID=392012 RepID=UPI00082E430A|nr:flagellar biosynthesis anti-sigma factor FlgM [Alicyclobacillus kakegawensis]